MSLPRLLALGLLLPSIAVADVRVVVRHPVPPQISVLLGLRPAPPPPVAEWTVSMAGALTAVRVTRGADRQPKVEACLHERLRDWRISSLPGRDSVVACTFPFQ